jgi:hypothetical protein
MMGTGPQGIGGFYYYDMPVAISGKQMVGNSQGYVKQDRNNIKKGGSTGGLLISQNSYSGVPPNAHLSGHPEYNSGFLIHYDYNHFA